MEKTPARLWRVLLSRRLLAAGYPAEKLKLDFWDWWLLGMMGETDEENR